MPLMAAFPKSMANGLLLALQLLIDDENLSFSCIPTCDYYTMLYYTIILYYTILCYLNFHHLQLAAAGASARRKGKLQKTTEAEEERLDNARQTRNWKGFLHNMAI